jgi:hypothetical protein
MTPPHDEELEQAARDGVLALHRKCGGIVIDRYCFDCRTIVLARDCDVIDDPAELY